MKIFTIISAMLLTVVATPAGADYLYECQAELGKNAEKSTASIHACRMLDGDEKERAHWYACRRELNFHRGKKSTADIPDCIWMDDRHDERKYWYACRNALNNLIGKSTADIPDCRWMDDKHDKKKHSYACRRDIRRDKRSSHDCRLMRRY